MKMSNKNLVAVCLVGLMLMAFGSPALAALTGDTDALGTGICSLVNVLTGKWLFGFSILALLGGGAALMFGGEISDMMKKVATLFTVVGIILVGSAILTKLFATMGIAGMSC